MKKKEDNDINVCNLENILHIDTQYYNVVYFMCNKYNYYGKGRTELGAD